MNEKPAPVLWVVVPCYDEAEALPETAPAFLSALERMESSGLVSPGSRVLFVDDGSGDGTWGIISGLAASDPRVLGISLSRNRGHQNALLAGLMEARGRCDACVSADADGQDDLSAMAEMVRRYREGADVVYGVRSSRATDTAFKRGTARAFYRLLTAMGVECVYDHADYRLMSARALDGLASFREVNLFLRGMVPLVGYPSATVEYERRERAAGESHYPLSKMVGLALDGITSLSVRPIRLIAALGVAVSLASLAGVLWAVVSALSGGAVPGWASMTAILCFLGGCQLLALGVVGEYVGRIYLEAKARPRYIVAERAGSSFEGRGGDRRPRVHAGFRC